MFQSTNQILYIYIQYLCMIPAIFFRTQWPVVIVHLQGRSGPQCGARGAGPAIWSVNGGTPSHHGCSNTKPCSWSSMTWMLNGYPKFWTSLYLARYEMRSYLRVRKNTKSWSSMTWMSKGYPYDLGNLQIALTCLDSSRDITDINGYFMKYTSSVV